MISREEKPALELSFISVLIQYLSGFDFSLSSQIHVHDGDLESDPLQ